MRVVSNASPLIFLSKLEAVDLLSHCFSSVTIPEAVKSEVGAIYLPESIGVTAVSEFGEHFVAGALGVLHQGELEAMVLAQELKADLILLDDLRARQKATRMGLTVMGTLGVLQLAHRKQLITQQEFRQYLDDLVNRHGMWLSEKMLKTLRNLD
jgi:predicted nucleic acid-binding protein